MSHSILHLKSPFYAIFVHISIQVSIINIKFINDNNSIILPAFVSFPLRFIKSINKNKVSTFVNMSPIQCPLSIKDVFRIEVIWDNNNNIDNIPNMFSPKWITLPGITLFSWFISPQKSGPTIICMWSKGPLLPPSVFETVCGSGNLRTKRRGRSGTNGGVTWWPRHLAIEVGNRATERVTGNFEERFLESIWSWEFLKSI